MSITTERKDDVLQLVCINDGGPVFPSDLLGHMLIVTSRFKAEGGGAEMLRITDATVGRQYTFNTVTNEFADE